MNPTARETSGSSRIQTVLGNLERWNIDRWHKEGAAQLAGCPVCGSKDSSTFYRVLSAPVTCASLFPTAAEANLVHRGTVELSVCGQCGHIFDRAFDPSLAEIGARYESSQRASGQFRSCAHSLASDWAQRLALTGKAVLEVDCRAGDFMVAILRTGASKVVGIDPLLTRSFVTSELDDRSELIPSKFNEAHTRIKADALVCRHTLEHIMDMAAFLQLVAQWARNNPSGVVLFEVPASERIFSEDAFWDIYYEHCNYFTQTTLAHAFARFGLVVERVQQAYDSQYLVLEARTDAPDETTTLPANAERDLMLALNFGAQVQRRIERARQNLQIMAGEGPIVIWQAAAKTVGFLAAVGNSQLVTCAIDLNVRRHEQYLPGQGLKVESPDRIVTLQPRHVMMNAICVAEVRSLLRAKGPLARLYKVDQVCERSFSHDSSSFIC